MPDQTTDDRAAAYLREWEAVRGIRYNWEPFWADIGRRVTPHQNVFGRTVLGTSQAERRTEYIFDSTAIQAVENCAALFESMLFPASQRWHTLTPEDPNLADSRDVRQYLEQLTTILFKMRYSPKANFAAQSHEDILGLVSFGTASIFTDEAIGRHIRYRAIPLQDLYFAENHVGIIDRVFRKFPFNAVQAADQWGKDKLPAGVQASLDNPAQRYREYEWLHVVKPRAAPEYGNKGPAGMPFESCYLCVDPIAIVEEGGYRTMPYATSRYLVGPREVYGRSPAFTSLADIKMLNEMSRTDINASQMAAQPPILLPEAGQSFSFRPNANNYGYVTDDGKPLAIPFISGAKLDISEEKMESRRKSIRAAFQGDLYAMLMEHPDLTATQVLQMAQERGILLAPVMGRQQSELAGNLIARELDIAIEMGLLNGLQMPDELVQAGGAIVVEYSAPFNQLQKAQDVIGISRSFEVLMPFVEAGHPEVMDIFDPEELARTVAEGNGVQAKILRSTEQFQQIQQQKAQAANMQQLVAAAPQAASAAKDLATAHATATQAPPQQEAA